MGCIGYARVSTDKQTLDLQLDALKAAGCDRIFEETASGSNADRPQLAAALNYMRSGDVFVVWKLDRLARSMLHLSELVSRLRDSNIGFRSLTQDFDTTTAGGRMIFGVFASLAEFERELLRDRTLEGLKAARARGHVGGRPTKLTPAAWLQVQQMVKGGSSVSQAARAVGVSSAAIYQKQRRAGQPLPWSAPASETDAA